MTRAHEGPQTPALSELLARYLERQASAQAAGLAAPEDGGEVVPFEAAPVQPVDPRLAWDESLAALHHFRPDADLRSVQASPDWPALVAGQEPAAALAFCVGNFPQLIRSLHPLWQAANLTDLRPAAGRPAPAPALLEWATPAAEKKQYPQALVALGALRLARQFDAAADLIRRHRAKVPAEWRLAWANEEAALAWHAGRADEAAAAWQAQPDSAPVLFNRGMAALFLGHSAKARSHLTAAAGRLPEDGAWHHLARLYLALAETRD
jgi:hypothetical protein